MTASALVRGTNFGRVQTTLLPAQSGVYALLLRLPGNRRIHTGRLGEFVFPSGDYVYIGSALGPGGLRARLGHHLRDGKKAHWHIDYLRAWADVLGCLYMVNNKFLGHSILPPMECCWSQAVARLSGGKIPVVGFGSSDCRSGCQSHLIAYELGWHSKYPDVLKDSLLNQNIHETIGTFQVLPEVK